MRTTLLAGVVLTLSVFVNDARAEEGYWNQFRGPHADGTTQAKGLPLKFAEGSPEIVWKTEVKGRAWSSPVVWGNQIWMTNAPEITNPEGATNQDSFSKGAKPLETPIRLSAVCLDLETGKVIYDITVTEVSEPQYTHPTNSYASPTPWIEEGRIYVHFGTYGTACIDTTTGTKIWENHELECHHWRGPGSSPVVHGDLIYLTFDGYDKQFIAALNKNTGKLVWKRDRDVDYGTDNGDRKKAYSTPMVVDAGGGREVLVSPFAMATIAYALDTGEPVWKVIHGGMNAGSRPMFGNGLVYISAGSGADSLIAVDPKGNGDVTNSHIRWRSGRMIPKRPSQVLVGQKYFMMEDGGVCSCLNALTGDVIWANRVSGAYWSSPLYADGYLYCCSQDGKVAVVKADDEFELVHETVFEKGFTASPVVAGNSLILRSESHVYRIAKQD
ncbi:MAG: PQQ-binding-like beta-propeller repeat protein [Planctomycetota bacterium]|nr:PQQ-binding-like beta-propeller repeat protein [Planctomycetota bacterium]MDA1165764.1 PQQ-binding-like beta-propeller repeat protein [Planctomycetota bacterium]